MNRYRLRAFTIMEVTIAMLLAAIVMGITYTAYSIIVHSYLSYHHKNEDMNVLIRMDELLKKDFAQADKILKTKKGIDLEGSTGLVKYEIDSDFIVRTSTIIDTFKVRTQASNLYFEDKPLNEVAPNEKSNLVDELGLTVSFQGQQVPYRYFKLYSSANLIERNTNASN